jgi:hypothetical protein
MYSIISLLLFLFPMMFIFYWGAVIKILRTQKVLRKKLNKEVTNG